MSVVKVKAQKEFTVLYNVVLQDPNLSFKAKGLWAYCMSKPDDWEFHVSHLATVSKDKEKAVYAALDELIEAGLVTRTQGNKGKGERKGREGFGRVEYTIYPYPQEIKEIFAHRRFGDTQNAHAQKDALLNTDIHKELKETKEGRAAPPPLPSCRKKIKEEKQEIAPGVWLTPTQRNDVLRRLGMNTDKATQCYEKLSSWKIGKQMVGGQDYRMIINWVIKAIEEQPVARKPLDCVQAHKLLAEKVKLQHPTCKDIELGYNYIEFRLGRMGVPDPHIKFGDNGFEEQVNNNLRKMGLSIL